MSALPRITLPAAVGLALIVAGSVAAVAVWPIVAAIMLPLSLIGGGMAFRATLAG